MNTKTASRLFPRSQAAIIHQDGSKCGPASKGVEVILHTRENEKDHCCAEIVSGDHCAEIGLSFADGELTDYDGVFFLPREVGEMLVDAGYVVPGRFFA
jgi:hypothetical protein